MTYKITITEVSKCIVEVQAASPEEAREKVEREYWKDPSEFVLEPKDTFFE